MHSEAGWEARLHGVDDLILMTGAPWALGQACRPSDMLLRGLRVWHMWVSEGLHPDEVGLQKEYLWKDTYR